MSIEMNLSFAFNVAMTLMTFLGGWLLRSLFERMRGLEQADLRLADQVSKLREELPAMYVRRDDFKEALNNIFGLLRRIEDKMDNKADRNEGH